MYREENISIKITERWALFLPFAFRTSYSSSYDDPTQNYA